MTKSALPEPEEMQVLQNAFGTSGLVVEFALTVCWPQTPLGSPSQWPPLLRSSLRQCMDSGYPAMLLWGADSVFLCNDAAAAAFPVAAVAAVGQPLRAAAFCNGKCVDTARRGSALVDRAVRVSRMTEGKPQEAWYDVHYTPVRETHPSVIAVHVAYLDCTAAVILRKSGGLHHWFRNNLQVISSLLGWEAMEAGDERLRHAMEKSSARIHALSLIHDQLAAGESPGAMDLPEYVHRTVSYFLESNDHAPRVSLTVSGHATLDHNRMLPCGLLLQEIAGFFCARVVCGAGRAELSFAFAGEDQDILIRFSAKEVGSRPPADWQILLGSMKLVHALLCQLRTSLNFDPECEMGLHLRIPLEAQKCSVYD